VMIAFDADAAGQRANLRGVDLAWSLGLNVKVIVMPKGLDPDAVAIRSADEWRGLVKKSSSLMDYLFATLKNDLDLKRVDHKKTFTKRLLPLIIKMSDEVERFYYLKKLAGEIGVAEEVIIKLASGVKLPPLKPQTPDLAAKTAVIPGKMAAESFVAMILRFPYLLEHNQPLEPDFVAFAPARDLYAKLINCYNKNRSLKEELLQTELAPDELMYARGLMLLAGENWGELTEAEAKIEWSNILLGLQTKYLKEEIRLVASAMQAAEKAGDLESSKKLAERFSLLTGELNKLNI